MTPSLLNQAALQSLAAATKGTKWEGALWLVGGSVRDYLMGGKIGADFDLVLESNATELAEYLFAQGVSSHFPVVYARFGTAKVEIEGAAVELVTARKESYEDTSRKPVEVEPASLLEDALRRDFTFNTLLMNLHSGEIEDLLGMGRSDLEAKILRTPEDPDRTFSDDPLRMLRAVRFARRFEARYAPGLEEAIKKNAHRLQVISKERIREEFNKMLTHATAPSALGDLLEFGLLDEFAEPLVQMVGVEQGKWHEADVWGHTLSVVDKVNADDLILRLAALLHDVGKPLTRSIDENGDTRFFSHESVGASVAADWMRSLRYSNEEIEKVAKLVKNHMRLGSAQEFSDSAARRLVRDLGDELEQLLQLVEADANSLRKGVRKLDLSEVRQKIEKVGVPAMTAPILSPLSGSELMELTGLEPGKRLGQLKSRLEEAVIEGSVAAGDKVAATAWVKENWQI